MLYLQNEKIFSGCYLDMNLQVNKLNSLSWLTVPRPRAFYTITLKVADFENFFIYIQLNFCSLLSPNTKLKVLLYTVFQSMLKYK